MTKPRVLIVRAPGTNCDEETAAAWSLAGADVETSHIGRLLEEPAALNQFQVLTLPGGFSYGDDLGAGRILATRLGTALLDVLRGMHDRGGLLLGICNGFQVLVKAGLLPGRADIGPATLAHNDSGRLESRWIRLAPLPGLCPFVTDADAIELPVAHGEGKFVLANSGALDLLDAAGQIAFRYADETGAPTEQYPANPNGSPGAVAGLCDPTGRILGLMPHPERYVDRLQHPRWTRLERHREPDGLRLFRNAVAALK